MSNNLLSILHASIQAHLRGTANEGSKPVYDLPVETPQNLENGVGAGQADLLFADKRTIAASSSETLVLGNASLKDPLGNTLSFVKVSAIRIKADVGNTNNVVVGHATANRFVGPFLAVSDTGGDAGPFAGELVVPPGGTILLAAPVSGWASVAGASDQLKIANSGGTTGVTYQIEIIGRSA